MSSIVTGNQRSERKAAFFAVILLIGFLFAVTAWRWRRDHRIRIQPVLTTFPTDGRPRQIASLFAEGAVVSPDEVTTLGPAASETTLEQQTSSVAVFYLAPVTPSSKRLRLQVRGRTFGLTLSTTPSAADSFADGTPDWMRLHSAEDRAAFRRWFTELAERMADEPAISQPAEIIDCASLLRYSYREALRVHDDKWYRQFGAVAMPTLPSARQWSYPNTPIHTGLFRIRAGPYALADNDNGAFQAFADAKTLLSFNSTLLGRDIHMARTGDLVFYRVLEQESQYHSMIVTGEQGEWVVYHTGPIDKHHGEMRRVMLADLLHHPNPKWRPVPENPNFLGVFRWNILREE